MANVYRPQVTKPIPAGAEMFRRNDRHYARWTGADGRVRTAPVTIPTKGKHTGQSRIVVRSALYVAKYRDGQGIIRIVPTGCRTEDSAKSVLTTLLQRAERVKAGQLTGAEDTISDHQQSSLQEHIDAYLEHLAAKGTTSTHRKNTRHALERVARECRFTRLCDLNRGSLERWLLRQQKLKMSARNRNHHRGAVVFFANWCVENERLLLNPLAAVAKAKEETDPRRQRRALTEDELQRLLAVASKRPLQDALTIRAGDKRGEAIANLSDATRRRLQLLGWERSLIYKVMATTGLRKGELASLTVGALDLTAPVPSIVLAAADEKNRQGAELPLRGDLVADLSAWLSHKLNVAQAAAIRENEAKPERLPANTPLFTVPKGLVRILDRDLKVAGIPKRDERGRTVDVHALRHSFATMLSRGGVAPRIAQEAMRHSNVNLTMNTYTHLKMKDVAGALGVLPTLTVDQPEVQQEALRKTGTCDESEFVLPFVLAQGKTSTNHATADKMASDGSIEHRSGAVVVSADADKRKHPLPHSDNGCHESGRQDADRTFFNWN